MRLRWMMHRLTQHKYSKLSNGRALKPIKHTLLLNSMIIEEFQPHLCPKILVFTKNCAFPFVASRINQWDNLPKSNTINKYIISDLKRILLIYKNYNLPTNWDRSVNGAAVSVPNWYVQIKYSFIINFRRAVNEYFGDYQLRTYWLMFCYWFSKYTTKENCCARMRCVMAI